jgi:septal ring factor EnvC (AmiA/AmiB activator)
MLLLPGKNRCHVTFYLSAPSAERSLVSKEACLKELESELERVQASATAARQGKDALAMQLATGEEELKVQQESLVILRDQRHRMTEELARLHAEDAAIRSELNSER